MKEELKKMLEKINSGIDWSVKELPDVAKQILRWGIIQNIITLFFNVAMGVASYLLVKRGMLFESANSYYSSDINWCMIGGAILSIVVFIVLWCIVWEVVKIISSPKVYLIEAMKDLIKN